MSSKLWIVHRKPSVRAALARATGIATAEIASGGPTLADFANSGTPEAILLALPEEEDLAAERAFVDLARTRAAGARWILLCEAGTIAWARRLFGDGGTAILSLPPDRVTLRSALASAFAGSRAAAREARQRSGRNTSRF
ncbi:hypothetical protein K2X89_08450, partial [Myxococcota bacterium]|nr:hypothetical protein [Myxococcota bacterium]